MMKGVVFGLLGWVVCGQALAGGLDELRVFMKSTQSARGSFEQTLVVNAPKKPQTASGQFEFSRPGKFRWQIDKPYYQLLVADGVKLWVHDRDLNQVTVKRLGAALGASPAAILAGDNALEKSFELSDDGAREGLQWVLAKPRGDNSFEWVRMGFERGELRAMDLKDSFGQVTHLRFTQFERNPNLEAARFRFTPPAGADVVGE